VDRGRITVTDNKSQYGTLVNGQKVTEGLVYPGDVLQVGASKLRLVVPDVSELPTMGNVQDLVRGLGAEGLLPLEDTVLGPYRVGKPLGQGKSGVLFRASELGSGREVALKVFRPGFFKGDDQAQRFFRAVRPLADLAHPNLVALYAADKAGPFCWVAQELVEGETLTELLQRSGPAGMLDWQHALRFAIHLASGLEALHRHGYLHRNVIPDNVLVGSSNKEARLAALERARPAGEGPGEWDTQEVLAELPYMPPERLGRAGQAGDERSDLYSLGATVYHLLTGRPPFEGKTEPEVIAKIHQAEPAGPKTFQLSLPAAFERAVLRLLAKRPEDRYPTAAEVLAEFQQIAEGPRDERRGSGPASASTEGKITVTCQCGQVLQAREKYAGTSVRCPACLNLLVLPGKSSFAQGSHPPAPPPEFLPPSPPPLDVSQGLGELVHNRLPELIAYGVVAVLIVVGLWFLFGALLGGGGKGELPDELRKDRTGETGRKAPADKSGQGKDAGER
jgi:serine/threonine protein kinase